MLVEQGEYSHCGVGRTNGIRAHPEGAQVKVEVHSRRIEIHIMLVRESIETERLIKFGVPCYLKYWSRNSKFKLAEGLRNGHRSKAGAAV